MPRKCSVCNHPKLQEIDLALAQGKSYRSIAGQFCLTKTSIERHRRSHLPMHLVRAEKAKKIVQADKILTGLVKLQDEAGEIGREAREAGDYKGALMAIRERVRISELFLKMAGELRESNTIKQTVEIANVNIMEILKDPQACASALDLLSESKKAENGE